MENVFDPVSLSFLFLPLFISYKSCDTEVKLWGEGHGTTLN